MSAYNLSGEEMRYELDGLFARAVQHENDHLDGTLFIDRLTPEPPGGHPEELADLEREFAGDRERGVIPDDHGSPPGWPSWKGCGP